MQITIDEHAGFCFGVKRAIDRAEQLLASGNTVYSLGEMVHNTEETNRLKQKGVLTVDSIQMPDLKNKTVLFRSHGEPPESYQYAKNNGINLVDATCPVVLKLQQRVRKSFEEQSKNNGQVVLYGKKDHPETIGLNGQTGYKAIVVGNLNDIGQIDFDQPIELFSQTTMPLDGFHALTKEIKARAKNEVWVHDTICRQVANRLPWVASFAQQHDLILFVSGKKSSNGKMLFDEAFRNNRNSYFISSPDELDKTWLNGLESIGITGATSTPLWLMELVKERLTQILNSSR